MEWKSDWAAIWRASRVEDLKARRSMNYLGSAAILTSSVEYVCDRFWWNFNSPFWLVLVALAGFGMLRSKRTTSLAFLVFGCGWLVLGATIGAFALLSLGAPNASLYRAICALVFLVLTGFALKLWKSISRLEEKQPGTAAP
jgi:4-amino-4-deoxy-L-arabinose transferase-like glycosyltransferase